MRRSLGVTIVSILLCATAASADVGDCGQPVSEGSAPTASDALFVLQAAVASDHCDLEICDVNSDCTVTVTDALETLLEAVGSGSTLVCADGCGPFVPCAESGAPTCGGSCPGDQACVVRSLDEVGDAVTLCHDRASNPALTWTIAVDEGDVDGHLVHDDTIGKCDDDPADVVCQCETVATTTTTIDIGSTTTTTLTADFDNDGIDDEYDPCVVDPRNSCYGPVAIDAVNGTALRINANASAAGCAGTKIDCNGDEWLGDYGYSLPSGNEVCNFDDGCPIAGVRSMFGCTDGQTQDLLQCGRFVNSQLELPLGYSFAVANGEYLMNLYFANTFTGTSLAGQRTFDILIEDYVIYADFDQVAAAGGSETAVVRSAIALVDDGVLNISFGAGIENPAIKAIEILSAQ